MLALTKQKSRKGSFGSHRKYNFSGRGRVYFTKQLKNNRLKLTS